MKKTLIIILTITFFITSCNEEFIDPTRPVEEVVFSTRDGIVGAANGLQYLWTSNRTSNVYNVITANGFTTKELRLMNAGNNSEGDLEIGNNSIPTNNSIVRSLWTQCFVIKLQSEKILNKIDILNVEVEKATVFTHASLLKAMSLITLIQFYEKIPLKSEKNATFNTRQEVINTSIDLLKATEPYLDKATGFKGLINNSINYKNTVYAMLARTYLMNGDYDNALIYAEKVNLNVKSVFIYDLINTNPIADISIITNNVFQPINRTLGLPPDLAPNISDKRLDFYLKSDVNPVRAAGFFDTTTKSIPLYLPGEMILIKAEVYARKNLFPEAIAELNKVLTKVAANDIYGIGAELPPYNDAITKTAILTEIYKNRCIEMYMSGLKLEDSKRFERPGAGTNNAERNRNWYPYPEMERNNNPNTPANPEI